MILNNRKDTYDIKLSKRRIQFTGRGAARSGPEDGGGAHGAEDSQQVDAGDGRGPRQRDRAAERGHQRPQVPAGDANQLRRRRITNRGLRAPSPYKESGHKLTSAQAIGSQAS